MDPISMQRRYAPLRLGKKKVVKEDKPSRRPSQLSRPHATGYSTKSGKDETSRPGTSSA